MNPPGEEAACIDYLAKLLEGADLTVKTYEFAPGRPSLIARLAGRANLPPLCFSGHVDVVPLGAKPWTYAPFAGEVAGKKLCGRGSSDMKCGVAALGRTRDFRKKPRSRAHARNNVRRRDRL
jgi:succinyl-diaminopimelate desuccinylase